MKYPIVKRSRPTPLVMALVASLDWADTTYPPLSDDETGTSRFKNLTQWVRESPDPELIGKVEHIPSNSTDPFGGYFRFKAKGTVVGEYPAYDFLKKVISEEVRQKRIEPTWLGNQRWVDRKFPTDIARAALCQALYTAWEDATMKWAISDDTNSAV